jgi:hypothetical protein
MPAAGPPGRAHHASNAAGPQAPGAGKSPRARLRRTTAACRDLLADQAARFRGRVRISTPAPTTTSGTTQTAAFVCVISGSATLP